MSGPPQQGPERGAYDQAYYQKVSGLDELKYWSMAWWSIRFYAGLCRRLLGRRRARVLEVGCAHGFLLERLVGRYECWGVDVSAYALSRARLRVPEAHLIEADLGEPLPGALAEGRFDLIVARYVFEHLPQPGATIKALAGLLRPGGRLLFAVPDPASPGRRMKGERWFAYQDETHVSLLSAECWLELTREAGLVVTRTFSDGLWDVPYVGFVPRVIQYGLFTMPTMISVALTLPLIPAGRGENLIVIARSRSGRNGT